MRPSISLRKAFADPNLLGDALPGPTWRAWRVLLIAAMGEKLTNDERAIFTKLTGREHEPLQRVHDLAIVASRRGGKSRAMAVLAVYLSALCDHHDVLAPGERGVLLCVALDEKVAAIVLGYALAVFDGSPMLKHLVVSRTLEDIELNNGITLEVRACSFRRLRGPTYVGCICDEAAFWYTDIGHANPDTEVLNAVRPALLTTGGPLIMASSPYAKRGTLWETYRKHYGRDGAPLVLVAKGATRDFNATIPQAEIDRELERDRARNTAELLAEFRSDLETYVSVEAVEACVGDYTELSPVAGRTYYSFVDPAGGSGSDGFALAISHRERDQVVVDLARQRLPPFSPEIAVHEYCELLRSSYRIYKVTGDRWGGGFPPEQFHKRGVRYEASEQAKSDIYVSVLPLINSGRLVLPRNERLIAQFASLERTVARGSGRDNIDHPPNQHDDLANAVAGAAALAASRGGYDPWGAAWDAAWGRDGVDLDAAALAPPVSFAEQQRQAQQAEWEKFAGPVSHLIMR